MQTDKQTKPEISYSRATGQFLNHGKRITDDHMWSLWFDVGSADWTQGAFNQVVEMLDKKQP